MTELRHLRYFVAVADAGTVSGAAERLHLTQPGLSRQLRQLESGLGVELFDRAGGRLVPSSAGRALLPLARRLLEDAAAFRTAATFYAEGRLDRFRVGAPAVTLTDVVAPFIATLGPGDPVADVLTADGMSATEALAAGADLAIGTVRPRSPYRSEPLAVLPVWAYVPPAHAWAQREEVALAELLDHPLIGLPPASTARQALDAASTQARQSPSALLEATNGTVAQALAAAGHGVAVVSDDPRYGLVPLRVLLADGESLSIRLVTAWDSRHAAAPTLEALARRLSVYVCGRYGVAAA